MLPLIISGWYYDYFHDGICYYILEYYFGYHVAFGLLVVSMIIFMMIPVIIFGSITLDIMLPLDY